MVKQNGDVMTFVAVLAHPAFYDAAERRGIDPQTLKEIRNQICVLLCLQG